MQKIPNHPPHFITTAGWDLLRGVLTMRNAAIMHGTGTGIRATATAATQALTSWTLQDGEWARMSTR